MVSNKKGFGLVDAIGAVILIGIASVTITASIFQSITISTRNKHRLLTQSACQFYINSLKADINEEDIETFFNDSANGIVVNSNVKTFTLEAGSNEAKRKLIEKIGGNNTYNIYNSSNLNLNNIIYNYENVSITIEQTDKNIVYLYTATITISYYNGTRTEAMTYDFYGSKK